MHLAFFSLAGQIAWKLSPQDPPLFALPSLADWSLVNPLLYPQLPILHAPTEPATHVSDGEHLWFTSEIVLASAAKSAENDRDGLRRFVGELLVRLRHVSGQATMPGPDSLMGWGFDEVDELPAPAFNTWSGKFRFQNYIVTTAISAERIRAAAALGPDFSPPTHEVLLLDAIVAYRDKDYRKAILYTAISIEVAFGSVIEDAYNRILASQADDRFRVVELPQSNGTVRKDPVYERLQNRSRSDFSVFLHELSLYVLRRSLLVENQALYADAKRLYSTRNQLVHSGGLAETESVPPYPLDERGAMAALRTAVALFSWLGIRNDFPSPEVQFVSFG